jgi:hypothetical protein
MALANTRICRVFVACLTARLLLISVPADSVSAQARRSVPPPRRDVVHRSFKWGPQSVRCGFRASGFSVRRNDRSW